MARDFRPPRCLAFLDEGRSRICGADMKPVAERDPAFGPNYTPGHVVFSCPKCGAKRAVTKQAIEKYAPPANRLTLGDLITQVPCPRCQRKYFSVLASQRPAVVCEHCLATYWVSPRGALESVDLSGVPLARADDAPAMVRTV